MQYFKSVLLSTIFALIIVSLSGCSLFRKDAVEDMVVGSMPANPSTVDYYSVYQAYAGAARGLKGSWYLHNSTGGWELILYENGWYSLQKLVGYGMHDAEVGQFKLKHNILILSPNGQLDGDRRAWAPRKLIVMQSESNTVLVPRRYEHQFRKYGASRYVCFNRRALGEASKLDP